MQKGDDVLSKGALTKVKPTETEKREGPPTPFTDRRLERWDETASGCLELRHRSITSDGAIYFIFTTVTKYLTEQTSSKTSTRLSKRCCNV